MDRVQWIEHKGTKILLLDYSGLNAKIPEQKQAVLDVIAKAREITAAYEGKILFLSDVTGSQSDTELVDALRDFAGYTASSGKVEKECVVGIAGLQKMLVTMINLMSKSKLIIFNTLEEGKNYLVD
jgi:hypothetical protein